MVIERYTVAVVDITCYWRGGPNMHYYGDTCIRDMILYNGHCYTIDVMILGYGHCNRTK